MADYRTSNSHCYALSRKGKGGGRGYRLSTHKIKRGGGAETEKEYSTTKITSWKGEEISDTLQLLKLLHGCFF